MIVNKTDNKPIIKNNKILVHHLNFRLSLSEDGKFVVFLTHPSHHLKIDDDINRREFGDSPQEAMINLVKRLPEFEWTNNILDIKEN